MSASSNGAPGSGRSAASALRPVVGNAFLAPLAYCPPYPDPRHSRKRSGTILLACDKWHELAEMLGQPWQTLNVVLLMVLVAQLTVATAFRVLLEGTAGALGVVLGILLQIFLFFVIGEVTPKTFADPKRTERAAVALHAHAIRSSPISRHCAHYGTCSSAWPTWWSTGKGLKTGPFVAEEEIRTMATVRGQRGVHREGGAAPHPLILGVRRHGRPRGHVAAGRTVRGGRRQRHHRGRDRRSSGSRACRCARRVRPTAFSASCSRTSSPSPCR